MVSNPLLSVVIPCRNYGRFLPECLGSLAAQWARQEIDSRAVEVILADDASEDGSADIARELLPALGLGSWRVLELERQGRPGPVRNAGLELARGELLLCLDPDDLLLPGFAAAHVSALEQGADVAYAGFVLEEGGTRREIAPPDYHPLLLASQNILPPTAMFRRGLWDAGARFRSATAYEDWDFWVRLALLGAKFSRAEGILYLHRQHGANYSNLAQAQDGRAKALIVQENPGFFPPHTRAWARGLLRGEAWAQPGGRGVIPVLRRDVTLPQRASSTPALDREPEFSYPVDSARAARAGSTNRAKDTRS